MIPDLGLSEVLLSLLCVAFMAWAGVVWKATQIVRDGMTQLRAEFQNIKTQIAVLNTRVDSLKDRIDKLADP